jgi:PAS domain S-box-containing protein
MTSDEPGETGPAPLSAWSRAVLDSAMDAIIMIDGQGQVVYWNPAAASMFGRSRAEVAGQDLAELIIPPQLRGRHRRSLDASDLGRPGSILGRRIEVAGQRRDGSVFPVELTITRTDRGETQLFTGYLRDITQRQRMLDELRDSRTRMLEVSDRTRREIERDLHDGAQQQLVGAAMVVAQARENLAADPAAAGALLDQAGAVLVEAISGIREIARGVLPDVLADHGLQPALAELGRRSPIPVQIDTVPGRWPSTVEITLYFLAAEALTNAAKHGARTAQLHVRTEPGPTGQTGNGGSSGDGPGGGLVIVCTIADDGPGSADASRGTGLQGLRDRVSAVGGTLEIDSPAGQGTTITGRILVVQDGTGQRRDQREDR